MLRLEGAIRLTEVEADYLELITGFAPVGIKTEQDLADYLWRCKHYYRDGKDTARLHRLFDETISKLAPSLEVSSYG